jgi:hypothetical protein
MSRLGPVFCGTMFIPCIAFEITIDDELKDGIGGSNIFCLAYKKITSQMLQQLLTETCTYIKTQHIRNNYFDT